MSGAQVFVKYTYYSKTNSDVKLSAAITTEVAVKSDSSVLKYLRDKYPDKRQIEISELVWK